MSIYFSSLPLALAGLWIGGLPNVTALPVILLSAALQTGYSISLFKAYDRGQLSIVYPVTRGSAPVFIFILSYVFFDPEIPMKTLIGILFICAGLVAYGLLELWQNKQESWQLTFALITGLSIALYSITDAYGVIFLYSYDTTLASVSSIHLDEQGDVAGAAAMAMLIVYISFIVRGMHTIVSTFLLKRTQAWRNI